MRIGIELSDIVLSPAELQRRQRGYDYAEVGLMAFTVQISVAQEPRALSPIAALPPYEDPLRPDPAHPGRWQRLCNQVVNRAK
jgi:hypothetical protein